MEPLSGYLKLGQLLLNKKINQNFYPSWNFGPHKVNCKEVSVIIKMFCECLLLNKNFKILKNNTMAEANFLSLDIKKSKEELNWQPKLTLKQCVKFTSYWYKNYFLKNDLEAFTNKQIEEYENK